MSDASKPKPSPGSAEAVAQGCSCAAMDNHRGRGRPTDGDPEFWITVGCPLHSPTPLASDDENDQCEDREDHQQRE